MKSRFKLCLCDPPLLCFESDSNAPQACCDLLFKKLLGFILHSRVDSLWWIWFRTTCSRRCKRRRMESWRIQRLAFFMLFFQIIKLKYAKFIYVNQISQMQLMTCSQPFLIPGVKKLVLKMHIRAGEILNKTLSRTRNFVQPWCHVQAFDACYFFYVKIRQNSLSYVSMKLYIEKGYAEPDIFRPISRKAIKLANGQENLL